LLAEKKRRELEENTRREQIERENAELRAKLESLQSKIEQLLSDQRANENNNSTSNTESTESNTDEKKSGDNSAMWSAIKSLGVAAAAAGAAVVVVPAVAGAVSVAAMAGAGAYVVGRGADTYEWNTKKQAFDAALKASQLEDRRERLLLGQSASSGNFSSRNAIDAWTDSD
jgi:TolA-binding protein